jgi:hypothetical protein
VPKSSIARCNPQRRPICAGSSDVCSFPFFSIKSGKPIDYPSPALDARRWLAPYAVTAPRFRSLRARLTQQPIIPLPPNQEGKAQTTRPGAAIGVCDVPASGRSLHGKHEERRGETSVLGEYGRWAKKHPDDATMMGGFLLKGQTFSISVRATTTSGKSFTAGFQIG